MSLISELLERAARRALDFDIETQKQIRDLEGKAFEVRLAGLERSIFITISGGELRFPEILDGESDLKLEGSPFAFARYVMSADRSEFSSIGIRLEGDVGLAQQLARLLNGVDIDWEEWSSRYLGDFAAYHAGRVVKELRRQASHNASQFRMDVSEYLQEESRLLAPRVRVERLMEDIEQLRSDADRLDARVRRLKNRNEG